MRINSNLLISAKGDIKHFWKLGKMNGSSVDISSQSDNQLALKNSDFKKLFFNLPRLRNLCLNSEQARYAQNYLKYAQQLRKLNIKIKNTIETTKKVTKRFFFNLKDMKSLSSIQIKLPDAKIRQLNWMKYLRLNRNLQSLSVASVAGITAQEFKRYLKNLEFIQFDNCSNITDKALENCRTCKNLKKIILSQCNQITGEFFKHLKDLELESISIVRCAEVINENLNYLKDFKNLKHICLHEATKIEPDQELELEHIIKEITDQNPEKPKDFKNSTCISSVIVNKAIEIQNHRKLDRIKNNITDQTLEKLKNCKNLTKIDLVVCPKITGEFLEQLRGLFLKIIIINHCDQFTDKNLKNLKYFTNLEHVTVYCENSTGEWFKVLKDLKLLKDLHVYSLAMTDRNLFYLKDCESLERLAFISCTKITGEGFKGFEKLKFLKYLDITCCEGIQDQHLQYLNKGLKELEMSACKITGRGIEILKKMLGLERVILAACEALQDRDLSIFEYCESLKYIDISCCPGITEEGVKKFFETLKLERRKSNLRIIR